MLKELYLISLTDLFRQSINTIKLWLKVKMSRVYVLSCDVHILNFNNYKWCSHISCNNNVISSLTNTIWMWYYKLFPYRSKSLPYHFLSHITKYDRRTKKYINKYFFKGFPQQRELFPSFYSAQYFISQQNTGHKSLQRKKTWQKTLFFLAMWRFDGLL